MKKLNSHTTFNPGKAASQISVLVRAEKAYLAIVLFTLVKKIFFIELNFSPSELFFKFNFSFLAELVSFDTRSSGRMF